MNGSIMARHVEVVNEGHVAARELLWFMDNVAHLFTLLPSQYPAPRLV